MNNEAWIQKILPGFGWLIPMALLSACSGTDDGTTGPPPGPTVGTIAVSVATTGDDPDADGYSVSLDGTEKAAVSANGSVNLSDVTPGTRAVALSAVAGNCAVTGDHPRNVSVAAGATAQAAFEVNCSAMLGSIDVSVATTGQGLDPDGYRVSLDGGAGTAVEVNGSLTFRDMPVGSHRLELSDVADNCTVTSLNPQMVQVPFEDAAEASFEVECVSITFSSVGAYAGFSCGLEQGTGKAYCWGANADGELGTGTISHSFNTPQTVQTAATFDRLPVGYGNAFFMCGITQAGPVVGAGEAWCWGYGFGLAPVPLELPGGVAGVSLLAPVFGEPNIVALSLTAQMYVWPEAPNTQAEAWFSPPDGSLGWASVSFTPFHSCGVTDAGSAYCWNGGPSESFCGSSFNCNRFGQLGDGTTDNSLTPVNVVDPPEGPVSWRTVQVGNEFACGLTDGGRVYCWGSNYMGMLGSGDPTEDFYYSTVLVEAAGGREYTALSVGLEHVCALEVGGTVYCWGSNKDGQLGVQNTGYPGCSRGNPWLTACGNAPLPVETSLLFTTIDAGAGSGGGGESGWGSGHNCGIATDGVAYCWGANHSGELGDGSFTSSVTPVRVSHQAGP